MTNGTDPAIRHLTPSRGGRHTTGKRRLLSNDNASLLSDELYGYIRMRRLLEPPLAAESCRYPRPTELDRLERHIPLFTGHTNRSETANRTFESDLLRPAATAWDLRVLTPSFDDVSDLYRVVIAEHSPPARDLLQFRLACHELIEAYRTRNPFLVRVASLAYLDHAERLGRWLVAAIS